MKRKRKSNLPREFNSKQPKEHPNMAVYAFVLTIFIVGFLAGVTVSFELYNNDLLGVVNDIYKTLKDLEVHKSFSLLFKSFFTHFIYIFAIWFLALSIFGIIIVIFILFFIGFMYGFVLSSFSFQLGIKGFWLGFVYTFPQNIIILPLLIWVSSNSIIIAIKLFKNIYSSNRKEFKVILNSYFNILIFSIIVLIFYALIMGIFGKYFAEYLKSYFNRW
ncbi:MAG: spoIIM [Haloplasmataceae bacterium]|jgi:stage II sporulation protein M|nr:spoIIM [Haloplasmataceae bacterium]